MLVSAVVQRTAFERMNCSIAQTAAIVGEPWTPLVIRDVFFGITRFEAIQRNLGISRKVLAERLARLVEVGVLERVPYQDKPVRHDYVLTEKGADLGMLMLAMKAWGDRWAPNPAGERIVLRHESCGELVNPVPSCPCCGEELRPEDVTLLAGDGLDAGPGTREVPSALERLDALREG